MPRSTGGMHSYRIFGGMSLCYEAHISAIGLRVTRGLLLCFACQSVGQPGEAWSSLVLLSFHACQQDCISHSAPRLGVGVRKSYAGTVGHRPRQRCDVTGLNAIIIASLT